MVEPIPSRQKAPLVTTPRRRKLAVVRLGGSRRKHQWRWRLSFLRRLRQATTYKKLIRQLGFLCNKVMKDVIEGPVGNMNTRMTPRMAIVSSFTAPFVSVPYIRPPNRR
jgi:hypothetical protein